MAWKRTLVDAMFSKIVPVNRTGSCATRPIFDRSVATSSVRASTPSTTIFWQTEPIGTPIRSIFAYLATSSTRLELPFLAMCAAISTLAARPCKLQPWMKFL